MLKINLASSLFGWFTDWEGFFTICGFVEVRSVQVRMTTIGWITVLDAHKNDRRWVKLWCLCMSCSLWIMIEAEPVCCNGFLGQSWIRSISRLIPSKVLLHQYFRCIKETKVACRSFLELVDRRRTDKRGAFISKRIGRIFPARQQHQSCLRGPSWFLNIHPVERGHGFTTEEKEMRKQNLFETCWRWWLSWVHNISMDKESAEVHAVKAGGTVLQWVMKAWCPYYSWEIMCSVNAGESCRMWSWVNYWGNRKWENKIILKIVDGDGLVGYMISAWTRNLPRCM